MNTDKILAEAIAKDYVPKDNAKIIALNYFYIDKNSSIEIFGLDWLQFKFVFNSGAAFSSFEGNQLLLAIVSIVASLVIEYVVIFKKSKDKITKGF